MASLAPGRVQLNNFPWNQKLMKYVKDGQPERAMQLFQQMAEHCIVDLLDHAGHLQEPENMVMAMPCKPQVAAWMVFFDPCRAHGNMEMAECVAKQILEMEPENAPGYVKHPCCCWQQAYL
ncbi:unnamed protein product [Sphagnum troendelagicum]|uniref:Uncharacterized protein n=1 Tax=Sphagnum troendelagicum TaxID=128251 RepID=A0ABP0TVG7_9BRYO